MDKLLSYICCFIANFSTFTAHIKRAIVHQHTKFFGLRGELLGCDLISDEINGDLCGRNFRTHPLAVGGQSVSMLAAVKQSGNINEVPHQ